MAGTEGRRVGPSVGLRPRLAQRTRRLLPHGDRRSHRPAADARPAAADRLSWRHRGRRWLLLDAYEDHHANSAPRPQTPCHPCDWPGGLSLGGSELKIVVP